MKNLSRLLAALVCASTSLLASAADSIVSEATIEAPIAEVWSAWTTSAGLRAWLAPQADIDLRVDGLMRVNYNAGGTLGDAGTIDNRILAYDPEKMLSIRVAKSPERFPFRNVIGAMWTVLYFDAVSPTRTKLRVVGLGFAPDEESQKMRGFFEQGNAATLAQLQRRFAR